MGVVARDRSGHEDREHTDGGDDTHAQGAGDPSRPGQPEISTMPGPARSGGLEPSLLGVHSGTVRSEPDPQINGLL